MVAQLHGLLAGIQEGCPGFETAEGDGSTSAGNMRSGSAGSGSAASAASGGTGGDPVGGPSDPTHYGGIYLPAMSRGPR